MHLFYTPDSDLEKSSLCEEESRHCSKVLRLIEGNRINLVDGKGGLYKAIITKRDSKKTEFIIEEKTTEYLKRNYYLHIAIAPTKQIDRFEWFLEKATEIGIDEITPILCKRSERKVLRRERLNKILISAMKQSGQAYLPKMNALVTFTELISNAEYKSKYIAYCTDQNKVHLIKDYHYGDRCMVVIGPEGDFTQEEITYAINNGFKGLDLGMNRLRTETAGVVACHSVSFMNTLHV